MWDLRRFEDKRIPSVHQTPDITGEQSDGEYEYLQFHFRTDSDAGHYLGHFITDGRLDCKGKKEKFWHLVVGKHIA